MAAGRFGNIKLFLESIVLLDKLVPVVGLGSLSAILWGVWGSISQLRPIEIGLVMFAALALTVLLINGVRAFLKASADKLLSESFRAWELSDNFSILDASKLLARSYDDRVARPYFRMLKERADDGRIQATKAPDNTGNHNMWSLVPKSELVRIGRELGRENLFE